MGKVVTRINVIPVSDLADQHLMAEYRELPMVNASLKRSLRSKRGFDKRRIPSKYTLNTGHVTFFYDKGLYLYKRYESLITELYKRGYEINPRERTVDWTVFPNDYWKDFYPNKQDEAINVERILLRLSEKPNFYNYNKTKIDQTFIKNLEEKYIGTTCYL